MEYISIPGLDDLKISRIALGTWAIGGWMWGGTDETESIQTILTALDKGINIIDTAPVYGFGKSEEIVGQALKEYGDRCSVILATKVGLDWDEHEQVFRNSKKDRIRSEIDNSLKRLQTDYIDLYQVHWPDPLVSFEETAEALDKLKTEGKVRAVGVSNFKPDQMDSFQKNCFLSSCQPPYNLFERGIEQDILPYCQKNNIALLTYGALCRGLLSGKMTKDTPFYGDDLRKIDPKFEEPRYTNYLQAVSQLDELAKKNYGKNVLQLAVRWILDQGVQIAIWGARKRHQLEPLSEVMHWSISQEDLKKIEQILEKTIPEPIEPEFMAPPQRNQ